MKDNGTRKGLSVESLAGEWLEGDQEGEDDMFLSVYEAPIPVRKKSLGPFI